MKNKPKMKTYDLAYTPTEYDACGFTIMAYDRDDDMRDYIENSPKHQFITSIEVPAPDQDWVVSGIVSDIDTKIGSLTKQIEDLKSKKQQVLALEATL